MIFGDGIDIFSQIGTKNSSTVANVGNIANLVYYKQNKCAATTSFNRILHLCKSQKLLLGFFEAEL